MRPTHPQPPPDEDRASTSRQLFIILWSCALAATFFGLLEMIALPQNGGRWVVMAVLTDCICVGVYILARSGRVQLSGVLLLITMGIMVTGFAATAGGIRSPAMMAYLIFVFVAGMLFGPRAGIAMGGICAVLELALILAERFHRLPANQVSHTLVSLWLVDVMFIALIVSLQYLATHTVQGALRQARGELAERNRAERRYADLVASLEAIVWRADAHTFLFRFVSRQAERILGYPVERWIREPDFWKGHMHPEDRIWAPAFCAKATAARESHDFDYRMIANDGRTVWLRDIVHVVVEDDEPRELVGVMIDITAHKLAEEDSRRNEARYRTLFEAAQDAIFLMEGDRFIECNPHTLRMFGCLPEQIIGKTPINFSPARQPDGGDSAAMARGRIQAAMLGVNQRFEWRHCRLEGHEFDAEVSLTRVELGAAPRLLAMVRDVSERKLAQTRLQQSSEQLRALTLRLQSLREEERTHISREIHDELGQMLTSIKIDLRCIEQDLEKLEPATANPILERAVAASETADTLARTVQRIAAELRPGLLDSLGLVTALQFEAAQFQERTGIICRLQTPDPEPKLPIELATAFFRIFQEALTNVVRHADATEVVVRFEENEGSLFLEVRDNGRGITSADLLSPESIGVLGMRERARQFGGDVLFQPGTGGGTVVNVRIPSKPEHIEVVA